ncbi:uracil-DNA glycosylase [Sphingomonas sp.]|uniref:uracil-DNA glycosylase n=1 Tax=Sphingomonas sp. TaxID=28214 RepID=UPI002CF66EC5|nr:uracil-DNA glycosylase [Sphingomonas sp.]HTG39632.1 uracil-DNA glycosylase [Sphingomonas sp.]
MGADQYHRWDELAASTLEWWQDAGVDTLVEDDPRDWQARPARPAVAAPVEPVSDTGASDTGASDAPADYAAFWDWRLGDGAPEREWGGATLVPPEGPRDADLIVLTDQPDGDSLIGGVGGAMFDRILASIGRSRDDTLIAGLAMAQPLAGSLSDDLLPPLIDRARRLLSLAPAKTVLVVGHTTSRALLAADGAPVPLGLHGINQAGRELQALAIAHPRFMLKHPQVKRDAWRCLQMLLGGKA